MIDDWALVKEIFEEMFDSMVDCAVVVAETVTAKRKKNGGLKFNESQGGVSYLPEKSIKIRRLFSYRQIWIVWVLIMWV